jgi:hypothetical protein
MMPRRLTDANIAAVCEMLDGWRGPLTWQQLVNAIGQRFGHRYTRQALNMHVRISNAYRLRKQTLRDVPARPPSAASIELQVMQERLNRLEAENARLKAENQRLLEQFVRWCYNASLRGMDDRYLNQALPRVDRERTKVSSDPEARKGRR